MLKIDISKQAGKFLGKIPKKQKRQISEKILSLAAGSTPQDCKRLKGNFSYYRVDIGEFRIIYKFTKYYLYVDLVGKRNDDEIYRKFRRMS
ncbi:MAG: type II toxin-antitoxin system RelE/ParE family toxin [bacterium]|nr:type II toxin-antitoxin system RelE/ParE family toxin [bacterium]